MCYTSALILEKVYFPQNLPNFQVHWIRTGFNGESGSSILCQCGSRSLPNPGIWGWPNTVGLNKGRLSSGRSLQPLKENSQDVKTKNFLPFLFSRYRGSGALMIEIQDGKNQDTGNLQKETSKKKILRKKNPVPFWPLDPKSWAPRPKPIFWRA